ncbi:Sec-independent protein translocase subunit TatA [Nocardia carnea]|uniref:Sec-independent protein translocase protein TatA n=1 Tax=Nocardia carnea TaxID=37328 RepID=A0ABW7TM77_9NOCA|nr:Sec-independent protein translocase subunit TatA [Nocardia carnea]
MGAMSPAHWLIIVLVFALFFGAKRLPDAARSLGRSMRIFKTEVQEMHDKPDSDPAESGDMPVRQLSAADSADRVAEAKPMLRDSLRA